MSPDLPEEPRLAAVAEQLGRTRLAVALCDAEWRLAWMSEDFRVILDEQDETKLGFGRHIIECFMSDSWSSAVTMGSRISSTIISFPRIAHDTPGGIDALLDMIDIDLYATTGEFSESVISDFKDQLRQMGTMAPEAIWTSQLEWIQRDLPPTTINQIVTRLKDDAGETFGFALVYDQYYPPMLLGLIARGDERMYERMARLYEPGRRAAAILFADLEASAVLSRKLSSSAYFQLVRTVVTKIDEIVVNNNGIVGKHAGDGATAFFIAEDCGSASAAALAAVRSARQIHEATMATAQELDIVGESDCPMRVGTHWGPNLFMGQLITGGRLEVTALGDEVNECARIEHSAESGQTLASKVLIEQLDPSDAGVLGLDLDVLRYRLLAEVTDNLKAIRDAGGLPVTSV